MKNPRMRDPMAQSAAPQRRLRDGSPAIPPIPLSLHRQFLQSARALTPVFRAPEKSAETIRFVALAAAPALPTNEFSQWARPADSPANQVATISEPFSHPTFASADAQ